MRTGRERVSEWLGARLFLGGGAGPDIVGKLARDRFEDREAGGVIAVVIGKEDAQFLSFFLRSP